MKFREWMVLTEFDQTVNAQSVQQIVAAHKGPISAREMRTDLLDKAFEYGWPVQFDPDFPVSNIGRRIQGYDIQRVLLMVNQMMKTLGLPEAPDARQIDKTAVQQHAKQLSEFIPPIIVSVMPDESYHLDDGNHRLGCAHVLGLSTLKAFVIQT